MSVAQLLIALSLAILIINNFSYIKKLFVKKDL